MTTTAQDRTQTGDGAQLSTLATHQLYRPPTVFGQRCPWAVVEQGYGLARKAIGCSLENLSISDAVAELLRDATPDRRDALEVAYDYLALTQFEAPRGKQVDALFLIEEALQRLDRRQPILSTGSKVLRRLHAWIVPARKSSLGGRRWLRHRAA